MNFVKQGMVLVAVVVVVTIGVSEYYNGYVSEGATIAMQLTPEGCAYALVYQDGKGERVKPCSWAEGKMVASRVHVSPRLAQRVISCELSGSCGSYDEIVADFTKDRKEEIKRLHELLKYKQPA